jgi:hypothetical protein
MPKQLDYQRMQALNEVNGLFTILFDPIIKLS